uniref:Uncharacterized protein n=1 Tax=Chrysotila carterae TaxID=13221 RepID=A0A7S4F1K6_CHRCT
MRVVQLGGTPVDSDALERAKQQLASFAVVGLYDAANKTSLLMEAAFPSLAKVGDARSDFICWLCQLSLRAGRRTGSTCNRMQRIFDFVSALACRVPRKFR